MKASNTDPTDVFGTSLALSFDLFGSSLALSSGTLVVGAPWEESPDAATASRTTARGVVRVGRSEPPA